MKAISLFTFVLILALVSPSVTGAQNEAIDWDRARQLRQRAVQGEKLTAEEQAYYERALAARAAGQTPQSRPNAPTKWSQHLTPLNELGASNYKGEDGG